MKFDNTVKRHLLGAAVITGLGFAGVYQQSLANQQVINPQLMADIVTEVEANPIQLPVLSSQLMADIVDGVEANPLTVSETRMPRIVGGSVIYPVFQ